MRLVFLLWLGLMSFACNGDTSLINGDNKVAAVLQSGKEIEIHIVTSNLTEKNCEGWRWGAENSCPRQAIVNLTVSVAKENLFIPRSAYADLGNPRSILLKTDLKKFVLIIYGGDAATSYTGELSFSNTQIISRRVESGENKESAWEETKFSFPDM